jgi:hypothetical protein
MCDELGRDGGFVRLGVGVHEDGMLHRFVLYGACGSSRCSVVIVET